VLVERAALTIDGYVRGSWKIRAGGIDVRFFDRVTSAERTAVEAEAEALRAFTGAESVAFP